MDDETTGSSSSSSGGEGSSANEQQPKSKPKRKARKTLVLHDGILIDESSSDARQLLTDEIRLSFRVDGLALQDDDGAAAADAVTASADAGFFSDDEGSVGSASAASSTVKSATGGAGGTCVEISNEDARTTCAHPGEVSTCTRSKYGPNLISPFEVEERMKPTSTESSTLYSSADGEEQDGGGLLWYARIVPDDYDAAGPSKLKILPARDYDPTKKEIKPRRKTLTSTASQFFGSLVKIGGDGIGADDDNGGKGTKKETSGDEYDIDMDDINLFNAPSERQSFKPKSKPPRWIFAGVLNGWPAMTILEVRKIEKAKGGIMGSLKGGWNTTWTARDDGKRGVAPTYPFEQGASVADVKVTLRGAPWTAHGWSKSSPGFVFWYEQQNSSPDAAPRLRYGTDLVSSSSSSAGANDIDDPTCTRVHMFSHRYATGGKKKETSKDKITYHSCVVLEWSKPANYVTVVEIGWLNGLGGYQGRSNWYHDKAAPITALYKAFPPELVLPWRDSMSEIRCHDVPVTSGNIDGFMDFVQEHLGHDKRFVDPRVTFSHDVRLTFRNRSHIATYLLNYIRRDRTYSEIRRNCQTFAADLCGFLAGKKDVQPFHPVNRTAYRNSKHYFLYESHMYDLD